MPTVKVNGIEVEVEPGTNMIEAAAKVGVEIPHYCYHPNLSIAGNCRMCLVDVEAGGRGPDIACNMQARDGLAIRTDTEKVETMRRSVQEFLLKNHPLDCPICDQSGECRLQDYYMDYGQYDSRLADPKVTKGKREEIGEHIMLDKERCVACSRCVRFGDEVTGTGELRLFNRTDHTSIGVFPGTCLGHDYQGNLADICPVGALTIKEFRFKKRVWYLKESQSVCEGCAAGCNIRVCHQDGQVFRYLPRRNDEVNKSWMCDHGRFAFGRVGGMKRLLTARVDGAGAEVAPAAAAMAEKLKGGKVGVVLGSRATLEDNWALARLASAQLSGARFFLLEGNDADALPGEDDLLMDADKTPNRYGARLIGRTVGGADGAGALVAAIDAGEIDTLLVLQDDALHRLGLESFSGTLLYIGSWRNKTSKAAAVAIPSAHAVEQSGTYVNRQGRVQRLRRALHPAGDSLPGYRAVDQVAAALKGSVVPAMPAAVFAQIAGAVAGMEGMTYKTLGATGQLIQVPSEPEEAADTAGAAAPNK
jgi:NADH-quinone oxidoreductase subunit G